MAGQRRRLLMFRTTTVGAVRAPDEVVTGADYQEQAQALCSILVNALPNGVVEEFSKLTGADKEAIVAAGMQVGDPPPKKPRGLNGTKLSLSEVRDIRDQLRKRVLSHCKLAEKYGVAPSTIYRIQNRATWRNII